VYKRQSHNYTVLYRTLLLLSNIHRRENGLCRRYIYDLRELALGFDTPEIRASAIYLLGMFYDKSADYNRAYSAYIDIVKLFPDSPESIYAKKRIKSIIKFKPVIMNYFPKQKTIDSTDAIDIRPDIEFSRKKDLPYNTFYSVSVGPVSSGSKLNELKNIAKKFGRIRTLNFKNGYILYIGSFRDPESALPLKIRLAEEYGINGLIVRVSGKDGKKYIYSD